MHVLGTPGDSHWDPLLDVAFEKNDIEMDVIILVNDNNIPTSGVIAKARAMKHRDTRIVDALIGTKLSFEQVIIDSLLNDVPPKALLGSEKIHYDYDYPPDKILRFLVQELRFLSSEEESLGQKKNAETKLKNLNVILSVCKSMLNNNGYTKLDIMTNLCQASESNEMFSKASDKLDAPGSNESMPGSCGIMPCLHKPPGTSAGSIYCYRR